MHSNSASRYCAVSIFLFASLSLGSAQSPQYFEVDLIVPHESVGEPEVQNVDVEKGNFTDSEDNGELQVRILGSDGQIVSEKRVETDYNLASPATQDEANTSRGKPARSIQEFRVQIEYNSSAQFLEVARNGSRVRRLDLERLICEDNLNASICQEADKAGNDKPKNGIPAGLVLIVLIVLSFIAYRSMSNTNKQAEGGFNKN